MDNIQQKMLVRFTLPNGEVKHRHHARELTTHPLIPLRAPSWTGRLIVPHLQPGPHATLLENVHVASARHLRAVPSGFYFSHRLTSL